MVFNIKGPGVSVSSSVSNARIAPPGVPKTQYRAVAGSNPGDRSMPREIDVRTTIREGRYMDTDRVFRSFAKLARESMVPGAQLAILHEGRCQAAEFGVAERSGGPGITSDSK